MSAVEKSLAAQILYQESAQIPFADIVGEMNRTLCRKGPSNFDLRWDHEDIAIFDLEDIRIVMATASADDLPVCGPERMACLTVTVGGPPGVHFDSNQALHHSSLCARIVESICGKYKVEAVLWQEVSGVVTAETVDELILRIPAEELAQAISPVAFAFLDEDEIDRKAASFAPGQKRTKAKADAPQKSPEAEASKPAEPAPMASDQADPQTERHGMRSGEQTATDQTSSETAEAADAHPPVMPARPEPHASEPLQDRKPDTAVTPKAAAKSVQRPPAAANLHVLHAAASEVSNDMPRLPGLDQNRIRAIRAALYDPTEMEIDNRPSAVTRITATAMDTTLIVVCLPVGAAMLTYHVLRGGEMRHSAHAVALTGLFLALAKTPLGQQMFGAI
jgi:hypothetical protein